MKKFFYTILFFADTLILILLAFFLLRGLDEGMRPLNCTLTVAGIGGSIVLLVWLLRRYLNIRTPDHHHP
ncbi:hypothetical protein [Terrimonas ferruginea]|uniref:hypothetical protein n=1 Tax=Terrimonas ferruginea TaxID=249 RepID=UPI00041A5B86|nr:hypothetical protein [Terrimonas ferruginea]